MLQPIIPQLPLMDMDAMEEKIKAALNETMRQCVGDFEKTTSSWTDRPEFYAVPASNDGSGLMAAAGTDDKIWGYVTRGTKAHSIDPSSAKVLAFNEGYQSKTSKGILGSHGGGSKAGFVAFAKHVNHPGTEAREFEEAVAKFRQSTLETNIQAAILSGLG